jgi:hypothetical protein
MSISNPASLVASPFSKRSRQDEPDLKANKVQRRSLARNNSACSMGSVASDASAYSETVANTRFATTPHPTQRPPLALTPLSGQHCVTPRLSFSEQPSPEQNASTPCARNSQVMTGFSDGETICVQQMEVKVRYAVFRDVDKNVVKVTYHMPLPRNMLVVETGLGVNHVTQRISGAICFSYSVLFLYIYMYIEVRGCRAAAD